RFFHVSGVQTCALPICGAGAIDAADQVSNRLISDELAQQKGMATVVPVLFYAVAAFLLNIVVGRRVSVQRQQIALMKAFGYGNEIGRASCRERAYGAVA